MKINKYCRSAPRHTGRATTYSYDGMGRLTQESETGANAQTISYTYDARSNRATMVQNGTTTTYTYDLNDRLTQSVTGSETTTYTYDDNGNQLTAGTVTYAYNALNQLTGTTANGTTTTYTYRADGLRHSKAAGGVSTTHCWDGGNIVLDISGSGDSKYICQCR